MPDKSVQVLVVEPEAYSASVRAEFPSSWVVTYEEVRDQAQLIEAGQRKKYQVVLGKLGISFNDTFFSSQPHLRVFGTPTTGLNHIDLEAVKKRGIEIVSLRGEAEFLASVTSTAEHAWMLLLALNRSLIPAIDRVLENNWYRQELDVHEVSGRTMGIIGMGRLGRIVARYGNAFGMKVMACDPDVSTSSYPEGCQKVDLEQLLPNSDYLVLLASYTPGDGPILGKNEFKLLRHGTILVNVARGELLDESALLQAVDDGVVRGFATDVLVGDSAWSPGASLNSEILERARTDRRFMITPHMGGYAVEAIEKTRKFLISKVEKHLRH